jgi:hypothetical protein
LGNDETQSVLFSFHCRKLGYQSFRESQQKSLLVVFAVTFVGN